jgi:predicted metal-dependent hydrolase
MIVEVIRSRRRKRTVSARIRGGRLIVRIPARLSDREAEQWVEKMKRRLIVRKAQDDEAAQRELEDVARRMNEMFLSGEATPSSIRYTSNQKRLFGSCSPRTRKVRISSRVRRMPKWVLEYLVLHELTHFIHPNHSQKFWDIVRRHPDAERARGFLIGYSWRPS